MSTRRSQAKKRNAQLNGNGLASVVAYLVFYPIAVWFLLWTLISTEKKQDAIRSLDVAIEWLHNNVGTLHPETLRLMGQLFFIGAVLVGTYTMLSFEYRRFRRTKNFAVPWLDKWVPPVSNWFFDEHFTEEAGSNKILRGKMSHLTKELDTLKKRSAELEHDKAQIVQDLDRIVTLSEALRVKSDNYVDASAELVRLMEQVADVIAQTDSVQHQQAFAEVMDEIANTIIRVTADKKNDKYSCIMCVDERQQRMVVVGCNGLTLASRSRKFAKGQGFAGSIWASGQHDVCDDVHQDTRFHQPGCSPTGPYRSMIGVPIFSSQRTIIGALFVQSRRVGAFNREEDVAILTSFSLLLSICFSDLMRRQPGPGWESAPAVQIGP